MKGAKRPDGMRCAFCTYHYPVHVKDDFYPEVFRHMQSNHHAKYQAVRSNDKWTVPIAAS
jgi:hypothetical protein